ncbi:MAG: hypothetical protein IPH75_05135 [bacterium]|nr:hypothetical protein [bacterium]
MIWRTLVMALLFSLMVGTGDSFAEETKTLADSVYFTGYTFENGVGGRLRAPLGIYCDPRTDEVFVAAGPRLIIYDRNLNVKFTVSHFVTDPLTGRTIPGEPKSIAVTRDGNIYLTDNLVDYVDFLDFRGEPISRIYPNRVLADTTLKLKAEALAIDELDRLYISVSGDMQTILLLDQDHKLIRKIGEKGERPENFTNQVGIGVGEGLVCVSDLYAMPAIKVFDTLGNFKTGWGGHNVDREDFSLPSGVVVHRDSYGRLRIWVSDALRHVIKVFSDDGEFVSNIGGYGERLGEFTYPIGLSVGTKNTFFISEKVLGRIQRCEIR